MAGRTLNIHMWTWPWAGTGQWAALYSHRDGALKE